MSRIDAESLAPALGRVLAAPVEVVEARRLSGGASRESWLVDARDAAGTTHALVLRRDPGAFAGQSSRNTEFDLLAAAHAAGVAAPEPLLLLMPDDGLGSGFFMRRIEGETIPRKLLRDEEFAVARARLGAQCAQQLAAIHAVPVDTLPKLDVLDGPAQIDQWEQLLDSLGEPHPIFDLGLRWMRRHPPPPADRPALVHGDFRNGNLMVGPDGLRAVLDWELAHLGDPIEDLGWLCARAWRFGAEPIVGGFGNIEELLDEYERAGARRPSLDELRWWIALATVKWGVMCLLQAFTHLNGLVRSVELAAIGRRVAETEWDLVTLLDGGW